MYKRKQGAEGISEKIKNYYNTKMMKISMRQ